VSEERTAESRDHAAIEELLASRALGALEEADARLLARELATHGPGCEECARLEREYAEVAAALAAALDPIAVRDGLQDEVVARALVRRPGPALRLARPGDRPAAAEAVGPADRSGRRRVLRALGALAAAAALVVGGWVLRDLTLPPVPGVPVGAVVARFEGRAPGVLVAAFRPEEPGMVLLGEGLPEPPRGRRYELWVIRAGRPIRAGCFAPLRGQVAASMETEVQPADLLAVTVEPAACPASPTAEPILTASIEAS